MEIDDWAHARWIDWTTDQTTKSQSVWLPDYTLTQYSQLPFVTNNLSGITYNPDSNRFWVVINSPQRLIELDTQLNPVRTIELTNFDDTEAVAYAGNKGFEGVAVDIGSDTIYVVKERNPMRLLSVHGLLGESTGVTVSDHQINVKKLYLDDLSGLHFDHASGNLLFLSDESKALGEINLSGTTISFLDLINRFHGLDHDVPQAEGITIGPERSIFVVSEPNLVYRFDAS